MNFLKRSKIFQIQFDNAIFESHNLNLMHETRSYLAEKPIC